MPKSADVINGKGISDSSKKLYLANLKRLNGGVEPSNYKFLEDTKAIEEKIDKYSQNTKRTYYISIVSFLCLNISLISEIMDGKIEYSILPWMHMFSYMNMSQCYNKVDL